VTAESCLLNDATTLPANPAGFVRLYEEYGAEVQRFLLGLRLGLDAAAIEDAIQETFLRLFRLVRERGTFGPGYDARRRPGPYILGVARHVALDLCRRPRVARLDAAAPVAAKRSDRHRRSEQREVIDQVMGTLEPELRTALVLRHMNGLSMDEVAVALGCSVPTARARVENAGQLFAVELRRRGIDGGELST
jgi:RNA polymerase sigma-70 factor (ECF subfamily)